MVFKKQNDENPVDITEFEIKDMESPNRIYGRSRYFEKFGQERDFQLEGFPRQLLINFRVGFWKDLRNIKTTDLRKNVYTERKQNQSEIISESKKGCWFRTGCYTLKRRRILTN
jgi:hypothetical protein